MRKLSKKNKELIKRMFIYSGMVLSVIFLVTMVTLSVLGFRFNLGNGEIEQYSFLRFGSAPSGAKVTIDGVAISSRTPNKSSVKPGQYLVEMKKDGYADWSKTINITKGTIRWLNYALFVPKTLLVEPIADYAEIFSSVASPTRRSFLLQYRADSPIFDLVDLSLNEPKTTNLILPPTVYSGSELIDTIHKYDIFKWDGSGRYALIRHSYDEKFEWLVIDTQNISLSKNITRNFAINIDDIDFAGTSGNSFFMTDSGDLRKLDLAASTISGPLVSNVNSMNVYGQNIVAFVGNASLDSTQIIGLYRDGDETSYAVQTISNINSDPVRAIAFRYFNEDFIAYSVGKNVNIFGGTYPTSVADSETSMKLVTSFEVDGKINQFDFSHSGEFLLVRSDSSIYTYDLEHQSLMSSKAGCTDNPRSLGWLNDNYLWSTCNDSLVIREFDGENSHTINKALMGQAVALTHNGKYIYSVNKIDTGYQLQRTRMILP